MCRVVVLAGVIMLVRMGSLVGAASLARGTTVSDGAEAALSPASFVATTVNVYSVPFVSSVIRHAVITDVMQVRLPGVDVTV